MADLSLGEAARALGVSVDTLRRWDRDGKLQTVRDKREMPNERPLYITGGSLAGKWLLTRREARRRAVLAILDRVPAPAAAPRLPSSPRAARRSRS